MGEVKLRVPFGLSSEDKIDAEKLDAMPSEERLELFGGLVDQVRELEKENRSVIEVLHHVVDTFATLAETDYDAAVIDAARLFALASKTRVEAVQQLSALNDDAMPLFEKAGRLSERAQQALARLKMLNNVWGDRGGWEQYGGQEDGSDV